MKLKLCITTFLIIFQIYQSFGQGFAPIGAEWHYTEKFAFSGDISYLWIGSVGDTSVKGKHCRILESNGGIMCSFYHEKYFVYDEDSIAYFYVPEIDKFQILYNLKAQKDSSWTIVFGTNISAKLDTIQVFVDSVSYVTVNSRKLKKLHVSYNSLNYGWEDFEYEGEIIEHIGDIHYLFNLHSLSGLVCDGNYSEGLRCYEDSEFGYYSSGIAESCTYTYKWIGVESYGISPEFKVYPNPASDWIDIEGNTDEMLMINILDLSGKVLYNSEIVGYSRIDLKNFMNGIYILRIQEADKILEYRKIIKN